MAKNQKWTQDEIDELRRLRSLGLLLLRGLQV